MGSWLRRPVVLAWLITVVVVLGVAGLLTLKIVPECQRAHPGWSTMQCLTEAARRTAPPALKRLFPPQLTLSWTDNAGGQAGMRVERKTGTGGVYALVATLPPGATSYVDPAVATATTYCYRVKAYTTAGESGYTNEACGTVASATFTITTSLSGSGSVASAPAGIACPTACHAPFPSGSLVTLTATGSGGSTFSGWSGGGCGGTGTCALTGNVPVSVTAMFTATPPPPPPPPPPASYTLTVSKLGQGTVTSAPAGITCGADCTQSYPGGTAVALTAAPKAGWQFNGWNGGGCTGTGGCTLTLSGNTSVGASFSKRRR